VCGFIKKSADLFHLCTLIDGMQKNLSSRARYVIKKILTRNDREIDEIAGNLFIARHESDLLFR